MFRISCKKGHVVVYVNEETVRHLFHEKDDHRVTIIEKGISTPTTIEEVDEVVRLDD